MSSPPARLAVARALAPLPKRLARLRYLIIAPAFRDWDLGRYCERLLRADHLDCAPLAYGERPDSVTQASLLEAVRRHRPDVVIGLKLDGLRPETLAAIRRQACVVLWYVDCHSPSVPPWLAALLPHVDLFCSTAKGMLPAFAQYTDAPVRWLYEGVHLPSFPRRPRRQERLDAYRSEVAFVGNIRHALTDPPTPRERLLRTVHRHFDLRIWGPQGLPSAARDRGLKITPWPAYNGELVRICHAADIVLGTNSVNSVELYFSNRTFLTLAGGGFHLTSYVPGLERMFENRRHLVWFHSPEECLDLIRFYLQRPRLRRAIARRGQAWTRRRYGMRRSWRRLAIALDEVYPGRRG